MKPDKLIMHLFPHKSTNIDHSFIERLKHVLQTIAAQENPDLHNTGATLFTDVGFFFATY